MALGKMLHKSDDLADSVGNTIDDEISELRQNRKYELIYAEAVNDVLETLLRYGLDTDDVSAAISEVEWSNPYSD